MKTNPFESDEDLTIEGPGSPVDLDKFLKSKHFNSDSVFNVLIPHEIGVDETNANVVSISHQDCIEQAYYFRDNVFEKTIPNYLLEFMNYFYNDDYSLPVDNKLIVIKNLIKYLKSNEEAAKCVGLIMLIHDSLLLSKHYKKSIRLFLKFPENSLHPKRNARVMSVLHQLIKKFK